MYSQFSLAFKSIPNRDDIDGEETNSGALFTNVFLAVAFLTGIPNFWLKYKSKFLSCDAPPVITIPAPNSSPYSESFICSFILAVISSSLRTITLFNSTKSISGFEEKGEEKVKPSLLSFAFPNFTLYCSASDSTKLSSVISRVIFFPPNGIVTICLNMPPL